MAAPRSVVDRCENVGVYLDFIRRRDLTDSKSAGLGSVFPSSVVCHRFAHSAIKEPTRFANVSMGDFAHIEEEIDLR